MPRTTDYLDAVRSNEPAETTDVTDALDVSEGHAQKKLKELAEREDVPVTRERGQYGYVYYADDESEQAVNETATSGGTSQGDESLMPVTRNYDFTGRQVERPNEYYATDGELRKLTARVGGRHRSGEPVRALIDGHTARVRRRSPKTSPRTSRPPISRSPCATT